VFLERNFTSCVEEVSNQLTYIEQPKFGTRVHQLRTEAMFVNLISCCVKF